MDQSHGNCSVEQMFFGAVTVGERGQVVIPAEARKAFGIDTGEKLLVFAHPSQHGIALVKIGAIVHYLEAHDTPVAEAAGVQTLLQGAARRSTSDDELLAEAEKTFDLLYEAYFEPPAA